MSVKPNIKSMSEIIDDILLLDEWMNSSKLIYNKALWFIRQLYFYQKSYGMPYRTHSYIDLYHLVYNEDCYRESDCDSTIKQYAIKQAYQAWQLWIKSLVAYKENPDKFLAKPKMPKYIKKNDSNILSVDHSVFRKANKDDKKKERNFKIPNSDIVVKIPKVLQKEGIKIKQLKIKKFYGKTKLIFVYEDKSKKNIPKLKENSALGIDLGTVNICAITSNINRNSWIVKGGFMLSVNQFYSKTLAESKSELELYNKNKKHSKKLDRIRLKRSNIIDNYLHNLSRTIVNLSIENEASKIVIGKNIIWKQNDSRGKTNNQNTALIAHARLIDLIKYKAAELGIEVICVEENYTSKCDHLAFESMEHHKKYLGKRSKRGFFKSSTGKVLNADINGAIGMLRKADAITDEQLMFLRDRGDVVSPTVLDPLATKIRRDLVNGRGSRSVKELDGSSNYSL